MTRREREKGRDDVTIACEAREVRLRVTRGGECQR